MLHIASAATNFAALFTDRVDTTPDKEAFRYLHDGEWVSVTWQNTAARVESLAAGLLALGIEPVHDLVEEHVGRLNAELNRWETIKKWALLERDLTVEGGELTPSLKVKRAVVAERNRELLDSFYV